MINSVVWWAFLILGPALYWGLPQKWRGWSLAFGSIGLLAPFAGWHLGPMLTLSALVFAAFRFPRQGNALLRILRSRWAIAVILAYLVWGKYLAEIARLISPDAGLYGLGTVLGISYFTFKLIHYVIEMRRKTLPQHGPADFLSWLFLAPTFTAGPIERFEHYLGLRKDDHFRWAFVAEGGQRIAQGIVKKFLFGTIVLELIEQTSGGGVLVLLADPDAVSPLAVWSLLVLSFLYLYLDFSAYSDIAIGSSRLFGLTIMENFNFPFLATSLPAFWRRWHMTLANWCLSYIYLAMIGLTRNAYVASIATFTLMGAWHALGPHWLAWGLWHGLGMATVAWWRRFSGLRKITFFKSRPGQIAGWALTMAYVALGSTFTMLHHKAPLTDSFRLMARAFGF